jgi:mannose-6-phosphate isomerase-like protein (cupin superfamily)
MTYFLTKSDCHRRTIFPGVEIFTAACQRMMASVVEFQPNAVVELHSHPHEQMGMVLTGRAHFHIADADRVLGPGDLYRIPGGTPHRVVALDGPVTALDFFSPVREDYLPPEDSPAGLWRSASPSPGDPTA